MRDYNLGFEFVKLLDHSFDITENRIKELLDQFSTLNKELKDLSDLINTLTACKEEGVADFSGDEEMRAIIDRIYAINPRIFSGDTEPRYVWNTEKQIDITLQSLDAEVKAKTAEVNQVTMLINVRYDERTQGTEVAKKGVDMWSNFEKAIIANTRKT